MKSHLAIHCPVPAILESPETIRARCTHYCQTLEDIDCYNLLEINLMYMYVMENQIFCSMFLSAVVQI